MHRTGMWVLIAPVLLAGAVAQAEDPAPATSVVVEDARGNKAEVAAFQETLDRFTARMDELEKDVVDIVRQREGRERDQLESGYRALLTGLEDDDDALRSTAIRRFESFLDKYPHSDHSAHVMFRLSELYFEQAEQSWTTADEEYRHLIESMSDEEFDTAPEEPRKDYGRSVRLYKRILSDYPDYEYTDGCYYMLGYCLSEPNSAQYDEEAGLEYFKELIENRPDSEFAAVAHLRVGEYYFDYNDLESAIPHYQKVVDLEGKDGKLYDAGLYKLAWSHYKLNHYDKALALLNELLDWSSDVYFTRTGRESSMAPEAIEYTAISFSDVADRTDQTPLAVAEAFYAEVGEREFENKVYKRLADVLTQQARYTQAIQVYQYLQQRWPLDPENPDLQWKIGTLYMSLAEPDRASAQRAVATLNERYNDDSDWWRANRNNPDALNVARKYIEQSLAAVAIQYHTTALESGNPADFGKAAEMYSEYLTKFPFADDYYQIEWWLADTLLKSGNLDGAEEEYEQLLKAGEHNYKEGSLWLLMQIRRQKLIDRYGSFEAVPSDAVVESKEVLPSGAERPIYAVGEEHQRFIEVCDRLVKADFHGAVARVQAQVDAAKDEQERANLQIELDQVKAYSEGLDANRHALAYLPAQILFYHGRFDEARPRFQEIIKRWPRKDEAAYAAKLMVDSYVEQEDLVNVRKWAGIFAETPLGPHDQFEASDKLVFKSQQEGAAFKLCRSLIDQNQRAEAADCFVSFIDEFPDSQYQKDALYNAANSYEIVGRVDESIRLFERYVNDYPSDERSRPLFFRLAGNYASALELDRAVRYYEELYNQVQQSGDDYADAPAALFNAGFLRIGLGDHEGAARDFERYATDNADQPDAEQVLFRAGQEWEMVGTRQALAFYRKYLKRYPETNPNHVMEALYRIASITEESGRPRDVEKAWANLAQTYSQLAARPDVEIGGAGRHYAAHAAFRDLQADLDAFKQVKFTSNDEKNADLLLNIKKNQLAELENRGMALVQTYQDFEYSSAALHVIGTAYLVYADMLFNAPPPKGLDEEEQLLYDEAIDEVRIPVEDKGRARLEANLQTAKEQRDWSVWQTATLVELNSRYPLEYAKEKEEFRGEGDSNLVPMAGPISVRQKDEGGEQ